MGESQILCETSEHALVVSVALVCKSLEFAPVALDTRRVAKVVPHPGCRSGEEILDPYKGKRGFPRPRGAAFRPSGAGFWRNPGPGAAPADPKT